MRYLPSPRHKASGRNATWCGLHGDHFATTSDDARVSCRNCRRSMRRFAREHPELFARNVTPEDQP